MADSFGRLLSRVLADRAETPGAGRPRPSGGRRLVVVNAALVLLSAGCFSRLLEYEVLPEQCVVL